MGLSLLVVEEEEDIFNWVFKELVKKAELFSTLEPLKD